MSSVVALRALIAQYNRLGVEIVSAAGWTRSFRDGKPQFHRQKGDGHPMSLDVAVRMIAYDAAVGSKSPYAMESATDGEETP